MSDETTHTEEALEAHTNEAELEEASTPSKDEEATTSADDQLDYDALLTAGKRSKKSRKGLTRKELNDLKAEANEDPDEDLDQESMTELEERFNQRMEEKFERLEGIVTEEARKKKAQAGFNKTLTEHGVDASSFKGQYQDEYLSEFQELLDAGLSEAKASSKALKMVLPKIEAKDNEERAEGRRKASLPPTQEVVNKRLVVKRSQLERMSDSDYNTTMERVESGELEIR